MGCVWGRGRPTSASGGSRAGGLSDLLDLLRFGARQAAEAEALRQDRLGEWRQGAHLDAADRLFDRVGDALQLDAAVVDDGVGGPRVAVAGLTDAAGVEDDGRTDPEVELHVRVADADDV